MPSLKYLVLGNEVFKGCNRFVLESDSFFFE